MQWVSRWIGVFGYYAVLVILSGVAMGEAVIYEPFSYPVANVAGRDGGIGWGGPWSNSRGASPIEADNNEWGILPTVTNRLSSSGWSALYRPIGTNVFSAGIMDEGTTLWFAFVVDILGQNLTNLDFNWALCSDVFSNNYADKVHLINNSEGIGIGNFRPDFMAAYWQDAGDGDGLGERTTSSAKLTLNNSDNSRALIVGKIDWGYGADAPETITVYAPDTDLVIGAPIVDAWEVPALDQSLFDRLSIQWKDSQPSIDEIRFGASYHDVVAWDFVSSPDTNAPAPNPMEFEVPPTALSDQSIYMVASNALDLSGVEYYFTCTSTNAPDSGWQINRAYVVTGLTAATEYTYTVTARDMSPATNTTAASAAVPVTTFGTDTTPPTPNPMEFYANPTPISNAEIAMTASNAVDDIPAYGVQYYFTETSGNPGGADSGWQDSPVYTNGGLTPETLYTYTVKARDTGPGLNEGTTSAPQSATTLPTDNTLPSPAGWDMTPTGISDSEISMSALAASDTNGVEYFFANLTIGDGSHDSGWQTNTTFTDSGLAPYASYSYELRIRDMSYAQNQTNIAERLPGITQLSPGVVDPSLLEGPQYIIGSQNRPAENYNYKVSVFEGKGIYSGQGNYGANAIATYGHFGDGTVTDYRFFAEEGTTGAIRTYAVGEAGLISDLSTDDTNVDDSPWVDLWETTDPGYDFSNVPPDFDTDNMITQLSPSADGTVDISSMSEGIIYIIYGAYRNTPNIDFVMSGPGQTDVILNDAGNNDGANNNENYIVAVSFHNAAAYDTVSYTYNSSNGRFLGVVLDGDMAPVVSGTVLMVR